MVANQFLAHHRKEILSLARQHGAISECVFGSAARNEAHSDSDFDFLIDLEPNATLIDLGALAFDLEELPGRKVDVVTRNGLHPLVREKILAEAVPL